MSQKFLSWLLVMSLLPGMSFMAVDVAAPKGDAVQAVKAEADDDIDDDEDEMLDLDKDLPDSPLALVGGEEKDLGELTEASLVPFEVEAENKGKEEVFFKRAMSTCACLKIVESPEAQKIAPGGRVKIRAELIGHRLGHSREKWKRWIYLEAKGFSQAALTVKGTFRPMIAISPKATMDLGEFEGVDVPWIRTFTIRATNPQNTPNLTVEPPGESKRFELKLTLKDEKARIYELEMRPKLPLAPGRINELIFLPVPLLGKDMGIRLGIGGKVLGRKFVLNQKEFRLNEADFANGVSPKRKVTVTLKDANIWKPETKGTQGIANLINKQNKRKFDERKKPKGMFYASKEELAARRERPADYKKKVLRTVELKGCDDVAVSRKTKGDSLVFTLTISPEILKQPTRKAVLNLTLDDKPEMPIVIYVSRHNKAQEDGAQEDNGE